MAQKRESIHGQWSSRWVFVLAATGSAVGLGNVWKFPYITGENGGGAFVLIYLLCISLIGIPVMMAEIMLGRRGRRSPINTMRHLAHEEGRHGLWEILGWGGVIAGFLILSYYSVIAGWALAFLFRTATGLYIGLPAEEVKAVFGSLVSDPERLLAWHTMFMVMTMLVVARGVQGGLEKAVRYLMPALFILLVMLVGYAINTGYFMEGVNFLFAADFSRITADGVLVAMGHAFFTLSLGMGAIMVYGSYLPSNASISKTTFMIAAADTGVALMAGLAIFPIVFANGLEPGAGPGLIFQTLPIAFSQMPGGVVFGSIFFLLLVFAAWTSAISLIEPLVAYMVENLGINRIKASAIVGVAAWLLGIGTVFSFNIWSGEEYQLFGKTIFDLLDYLTANILLPVGGLAIAIFAGWHMSRSSIQEELELSPKMFDLWRVLVRYVTPIAIIIIFLRAIGLI